MSAKESLHKRISIDNNNNQDDDDDDDDENDDDYDNDWQKLNRWPRRDLNTQPSDLESDALPLRHGVNYIRHSSLKWWFSATPRNFLVNSFFFTSMTVYISFY